MKPSTWRTANDSVTGASGDAPGLQVAPGYVTPFPGPRLDHWDTHEFTTPTDGVARDYVFAVTAINPSLVDECLSDRDYISKRKLFFGSIISDRNGVDKTFGDLGYIIGFERSNLAGASPVDTEFRAPLDSHDHLSQTEFRRHVGNMHMNSRGKGMFGQGRGWHEDPGPWFFPSPSQLLDRNLSREGADGTTRKCRSNTELLLMGTSPTGAKSMPIGIKIRVDAQGKDIASEEQVLKFITAAKRWNLPVVRIS